MGITTFYFFLLELKKSIYLHMRMEIEKFPEKLKKQPQNGIFTAQLTTLKKMK